MYITRGEKGGHTGPGTSKGESICFFTNTDEGMGGREKGGEEYDGAPKMGTAVLMILFYTYVGLICTLLWGTRAKNASPYPYARAAAFDGCMT